MSLTSACFDKGVFATDPAVNCISNLLAVGFRRILVDLYWSPERRQWGLCPVSTPAGAAAADGGSLHHLGDYSCTDALDLTVLTNVLKSFFEDNDSDIEIHVTYMTFNLHAAANSSAPDEPVPVLTAPNLPADSESLHNIVSNELEEYTYTPAHLDADRSNLDKSWFKVPAKYRPVTEYFTVTRDNDGNNVSPDGWPCSMYIQYASQQRLLLVLGTVDSEMKNYDASGDRNVLFPTGSLSPNVLGATGTNNGSDWQSACMYQQGDSQISLDNTSWGAWNTLPLTDTASSPQALGQLAHLVQNSTRCGLAPTLNSTLLNVTADDDLDLYWNISRSSMWSWAIGEPRGADLPKNSEIQSCSLMDTSLGGYWRAEDCGELRYVACRVGDKPFAWNLSEKRVSFSDASGACPDGTSFTLPRTGLENTYLYNEVISQPSIDPSSANTSRREIWLNYNCRDVRSCWVEGGLGVSCPYETNPRKLEQRTVQAAAVWSIIICVVAALTLFVKCNTNRRKSRRRKREIEGWEYEGVPS